MNLKVPSEVLEKTTKCPRKFDCLKSGKCAECEVSGIDGKNVIYLKSTKTNYCPYYLPFGNGGLCVCPTHYAVLKLNK